MTAPRITTHVTLTEVGDGRLRAETDMGERVIADATPEQERAYAPLLFVDHGVRITIEPADAPAQEEAPHGSPLDYLAQIKNSIEQARILDTDDPTMRLMAAETLLRRVLNLANSAHLALLNAQRGTP